MVTKPRTNSRLSLPIAKLRFYLNEWRQESGWPDIEVSLLLVIYDLLLLAEMPEEDMADALGADGVGFITSLVDSQTLPCIDDIPPWEPLPGIASHS